MYNINKLNPYLIFLILSTTFTGKLLSILVDDFSQLNKTKVSNIYYPQTVNHFSRIINYAKANNKKISIAGQKHSQGGHAFCQNSILIDITNFNKILRLDLAKKTITVQTGITWEKIQEFINPYNLAIKVMQTTQIFTVGGSLSVNAHGRDPNYGPLIETIKSIKILLSNGKILKADRQVNYDLFKLAIGGYGLFGIILEAEIELTDNLIYQKESKAINIKDYDSYVKNNIIGNSNIGLHSGIISLSHFNKFEKILIINYKKTKKFSRYAYNLADENFIKLRRFGVYWKKKSSIFNEFTNFIEWPRILISSKLPQITCRNNAMRFPAKYFEKIPQDITTTDILQSYFIPTSAFTDFMEFLRLHSYNKNPRIFYALSRYIPKNTESFLSYSTDDYFEIVLLIHQGKSANQIKETKLWTQTIVDKVLEYGGKYYLPVQTYPSKKQIKQAYPQIDHFFAQKKLFDPEELFVNNFYKKYQCKVTSNIL